MKLAAVVRSYCATEPLLLFSNHNKLAKLRLNKPKGLNALNLPMILKMRELI
jgi:enoyl-CoA hydratase/carnithine racemase